MSEQKRLEIATARILDDAREQIRLFKRYCPNPSAESLRHHIRRSLRLRNLPQEIQEQIDQLAQEQAA